MLRDWLDLQSHEVGGGGFMGKRWDSFVPGPDVWAECLRVLKPGGHAVVFAGSRTVDLMGLALRIAGFEIRDSLQWLYGSGFPKSLDVSKAIDEVTPEAAEWQGWGTALKPGHESIILARKPLSGTVAATVLEHGTGALNVDGCRVGNSKRTPYASPRDVVAATWCPVNDSDPTARHLNRKPPSRADDSGQDPHIGRWPANVILDEEAGALLDRQSGSTGAHADSGGASRFFYCAKTSREEREAGLDGLPIRTGAELTDSQEGQARLDSPRTGAGRTGGRRNIHPTVKPIALMRWLVRLITPPGGLVLDPFCGSGSTGCACAEERTDFIGCELDPEYAEIARRRIAYWRSIPQQVSLF
jgi:site-specific DNA-methyltransferase (adenine-specific)